MSEPIAWLVNLDAAAGTLTAGVAVWAWGQYQFGRWSRQNRLEKYLEGEHPGQRDQGDMGARTVLHLVAELKMSEAQIMEAAFRSDIIECVKVPDKQTGRTTEVMLKMKETNLPRRF
jgi:hypothetical protein